MVVREEHVREGRKDTLAASMRAAALCTPAGNRFAVSETPAGNRFAHVLECQVHVWTA